MALSVFMFSGVCWKGCNHGHTSYVCAHQGPQALWYGSAGFRSLHWAVTANICMCRTLLCQATCSSGQSSRAPSAYAGGLIMSASHNPGGPKEDWGIKFNYNSGEPAPERITDAIFGYTTKISELNMAEIPETDLSAIGTHAYGDFEVSWHPAPERDASPDRTEVLGRAYRQLGCSLMLNFRVRCWTWLVACTITHRFGRTCLSAGIEMQHVLGLHHQMTP